MPSPLPPEDPQNYGRSTPRSSLFRLGVGLSALAVLLAACGGDGGTDTVDAPADNAVQASLSVGVDSENFMTNMPLYVAREKGFFKDVGLTDVQITVTGDQFVSALVSDSVDISHGSTLNWFAAAEQSGEGFRWLTTLRDSELLQLGVGKGIETPEDLKGGKVTAGPAGSDNEANLRVVLEKIGLSPEDVEIIPTNPGSDAWLAAVLGGQLDGAMLFARHIAPLEEAGGRFLYQELRSAPQDGFVTSESFLTENAATVEAFLEALVKTKQWYKDPANKDEILQILNDNGFDTTELERSFEPEMDQQSADGGFELDDIEAMVQRGIENDQIPAETKWAGFVALEPLWAAQEAAGLQRRPATGP